MSCEYIVNQRSEKYILKHLPIANCQEKVANTIRHNSDYKKGGGGGFFKGKHILLTNDMDMYIETLTHF